MTKKKAKKVVKKATKKTNQELVIRVEQASIIPSVSDLSEPMRDGKKLTIPKTFLNEQQIIQMVQRTPAQFVQTRPGKGGQTFQYVSGAYVTKILNFVFGWNWDFEVMSIDEKYGQIIARGKLTVKSADGKHSISKMQSGRADIKFKKDTKIPLDYGNDEKAATTDALKKCASLFGIASDIYGKMEYKSETGKDPREDHPANHPSTARTIVNEDSNGPFEKDEVLTMCEGNCGAVVEQKVADYSKKMFKGKVYCRNCQKDHQK